MNDVTESHVFFNETQGQFQGRQKRLDSKKDHCSHCNMDGHIREGCFKLIGYPDWYKPKSKIARQSFKQTKSIDIGHNLIANVEKSRYKEDNSPHVTIKIDVLNAMPSSLQQEMTNLKKGKVVFMAHTTQEDSYLEYVTESSPLDYAGNSHFTISCSAKTYKDTN